MTTVVPGCVTVLHGDAHALRRRRSASRSPPPSSAAAAPRPSRASSERRRAARATPAAARADGRGAARRRRRDRASRRPPRRARRAARRRTRRSSRTARPDPSRAPCANTGSSSHGSDGLTSQTEGTVAGHVRGGLGGALSALERPPAGQQLERDDAEGVEVARRRRPLALAPARARGTPRCRAPSRSASASRGPAALAMPKSATCTRPLPSSSRFAGFTSRWTTPSRCAASSAAAACSSHSSACARRLRALRPELVARASRRARYSMTMYGRSSPLADVVDRDDVRVAGEPRGGERLAREPLPDRLVLRVALGRAP